MNISGSSRRGQPLLVLVALLAGWTGVRVATWTSPLDFGENMLRLRDSSVEQLKNIAAEGVARTGAGTGARGGATGADQGGPNGASGGTDIEGSKGAGDNGSGWPQVAPPLPGLVPAPLEPISPTSGSPAGGSLRLDQEVQGQGEPASYNTARRAVGQALLTVMGLSQMQLPPALAALIDLGRMAGSGAALAERGARSEVAREPLPPRAQLATGGSTISRWSADAWLLLRDDSSRAAVAGQPSYGRGQAGAVLRYRLAPTSAHAPQAYVRTSAALRSPHKAEIAAGLSARPIAGLPVRLAAEARVADTARGTEVRPAAYAVSEFPPLDLPGGMRGEAYVQGGYVGGKFATPFIDGQARVTRDIVRGDNTSVSAGAGAWGGAQKGTSRLDIGPSAVVSFRLAKGVFSRVAVDYRVRVAGDAEPKSGPALTVSAGF